MEKFKVKYLPRIAIPILAVCLFTTFAKAGEKLPAATSRDLSGFDKYLTKSPSLNKSAKARNSPGTDGEVKNQVITLKNELNTRQIQANPTGQGPGGGVKAFQGGAPGGAVSKPTTNLDVVPNQNTTIRIGNPQ